MIIFVAIAPSKLAIATNIIPQKISRSRNPVKPEMTETTLTGNFCRNLKAFRLFKNLSVQEFAELSGRSIPTIYSWENEATVPTLQDLDRLGKAWEINPMQLIQDVCEWRITYPTSMSITSLREVRKAKGLTQHTLGRKIGVSEDVISRWENKSRKPLPKNTSKLKDYFGIHFY